MCRPLIAATALIALVGTAASARAADVMMHFFPLTGEVRMQNVSAVPFEFIYYSITSPSHSLNGSNGVWTSIADTYDADDNGFVDPVNNWSELEPGPGDPTVAVDELTEAVFLGAITGRLPASRTISLGKIWNPNAAPTPDVAVEVLDPEGMPHSVSIEYSLEGDYNLDDQVNLADFTIWKSSFGFTFAPFIDGNLNGIVDAADYTVWRDNFGASLIGTPFDSVGSVVNAGGLSVAAAVPEPTTSVLIVLAFVTLCGRRYWTRSNTALWTARSVSLSASPVTAR